MSEELKEVLDGTIQVAVKSIISKVRKGQKLTASDLKALKELRASIEVPETGTENWDAEYRKFKALLARIEYETQRGELLPREEVSAAWRNRYSHIKRHLLLWSKRLPGRLAGLDERAMGEALEEEVHFLLSLLSRPGKFTASVGDDGQQAEEVTDERAAG